MADTKRQKLIHLHGAGELTDASKLNVGEIAVRHAANAEEATLYITPDQVNLIQFPSLEKVETLVGGAKAYTDVVAGVYASEGVEASGLRKEIAALEVKLQGEFAAADTQIRTDFTAADTQIRTDFTAADTQIRTDFAAADTQIRTDFAAADDVVRDEFAAALGAYSDGDTAATGLRKEIEDKAKALSAAIDAVEAAAKSYSIAAVTGDELTALGANVKEAYKLVDEDSAKSGEYIKIYKDSALQKVELDGQELVFTYLLASGAENVVRVDVSSFLAESEFKDGLQVVDHVVSVKVDAASETFLTVGADGVKLSGVQDAIDAAANGVSADVAELETKLYGNGTEDNKGDLATMKGELEAYADQAEADAVSAAKTYTDALNTKLYGDGTDANKGDLATMKAELEAYVDQAEADAKTYTDEKLGAYTDGDTAATGLRKEIEDKAKALSDAIDAVDGAALKEVTVSGADTIVVTPGTNTVDLDFANFTINCGEY